MTREVSLNSPHVQLLTPAGRPFQHVAGSSSRTIWKLLVCTPSTTPTSNASVALTASPSCSTPRVATICGDTDCLMMVHAAIVKFCEDSVCGAGPQLANSAFCPLK